MTDTTWFALHHNPSAKLRLFLFPYSGGGINIFRSWHSHLPDSIEVCRIKLPGRDQRHTEALFTHIEALVSAIVDAMPPLLDMPFALFGHSLGAQLAFEVARELRRRQLPSPEILLVSARKAPQLENNQDHIHQLPESEMLAELQRRYGGIPSAVMENKELRSIYVPILRADLTMVETYTYKEEAPFMFPISAYSGLDDKLVSLNMLKAWEQQSTQAFRFRLIAGGHFFINTHAVNLILAISQDIRAILGI